MKLPQETLDWYAKNLLQSKLEGVNKMSKKYYEKKNAIYDPRICKRCGCDFTNIPVFKKGCGACETPNEMFKRSMSIFKLTKKEK